MTATKESKPRYRHKRYHARRCAFQALYAANVARSDPLDILAGVDGGDSLNEEGLTFARELLTTRQAHKSNINAMIAASTDWDLIYGSPVELSILQLAVAEFRTRLTPAAVVINEAVELAKIYAAPAAAGYINGMLRTIAEKTGVISPGEKSP